MIEYKLEGSNLVAVIGSGHIHDCAVEIIEYMNIFTCVFPHCDTEFNQIPLRIYHDSNPRDIALIYNLKCELRRAGK